MKLLLVCLLAISFGIFGIHSSFAEKGTYADRVQFIQYLDENTALEEVRNGNLDLYYFRIPSDRIENSKAREGLQVFESTGGSYSILVNPAEADRFNPFSITEIRFALNYLVDRKLIVNELMGGYGTTMVSNYGPFDPDYISILNELESFNFRYNPILANEMISTALTNAGAQKNNEMWEFDGNPIEITIFIRSDDPVRKSIGEILSSELEKIGFKVNKDFGDLNKAFVIVYGSNPSDLKWNLYTEGWGGRSAFVRYDSLGLGQMYSPWFSNMPGFNDPSYWNYKNDYLDSLTQKIYTGNFSSSQERTELIQKATIEGVNESVRIFLASKIDQYVANESVDGVINDFGAGVPTRFTPINARSNSDSIIVGVKQIYQGAWNPVMGLSDSYSTHIWNTLYDPALFKHPYNGETFPVRSSWDVQTAGPDGKLDVPSDAMIWDVNTQQWENVGDGIQATTKVTFDLSFSNWHNGQPMDINDVINSLYFTLEWGSEPGENDRTFDTEYTPRAAQLVNTIIGIKPIDENTIEVYVDYWHFDEGEIASWASLWSTMPWEIFAAMEKAVIDGRVSFSRSGAVSGDVHQLSLLIPNDAQLISQYLEDFRQTKYAPAGIVQFVSDDDYFAQRYTASINWIQENNHAVISNGPFYLEGYTPESRTIVINAFEDESYPYSAGHWREFEETKFPKIMGADVPDLVTKGNEFSIPVETEHSTKLYYFLTNSEGNLVDYGIKNIEENPTIVKFSQEHTSKLSEGANDIKLFSISENVLRPDVYRTSFLAIDSDQESLPSVSVDEFTIIDEDNENRMIILLSILGILAIIFAVVKLRKKKITA